MMQQVMDRITVSAGIELPYFEQGNRDGVPVMFLHGLTDSERSFESVLPFLPSSMRAIVPTLRGHGEASKPVDAYQFADFARDVRNLMDALGIGRAVLVGHSMGTLVAFQTALDFPNRVLGIVPIAAFYPEPGHANLIELWNWFEAVVTDPIDPEVAREFQVSTVAGPVAPGLLATAASESLKAPAHVWMSALQSLLTMDLGTQLQRLSAPVRLLWGDQDAMALCSDQASLLQALPQATLSTYEGTGHAVHWEQPERVATEIVDFVAGIIKSRS
jgi:pimeloyl-ACP methyl ester carboxylesterase